MDVPEDLVPFLKTQTKKQSLKTTDAAIAKKRLLPVIAGWQREFDDLRARRSLVAADHEHAVWDHYVGALARDEVERSHLCEAHRGECPDHAGVMGGLAPEPPRYCSRVWVDGLRRSTRKLQEAWEIKCVHADQDRHITVQRGNDRRAESATERLLLAELVHDHEVGAADPGLDLQGNRLDHGAVKPTSPRALAERLAYSVDRSVRQNLDIHVAAVAAIRGRFGTNRPRD
jgi:hypothetical protein